jgi:O-antigen/teichoic acid export membrane protein
MSQVPDDTADSSRPKGPSQQARFARGAKFSAYDAVTGMVLGLAASIVTARVFGAEVVGALALASMLTGTFGAVANLREQGGLVRQLTRYEAGSRESRALTLVTMLFSLCFTLVLLLPFTVLAVYLLREVFDRPELTGAFFVVVLLWLFVDHTSNNLNAPLVAYRDGRSVWYARTAMVLATIASAVACWALGVSSLSGLLAVTAATSFAGLGVRLWAVRRLIGLRVSPGDVRWGLTRLREIISYGIRQAPTNYAESVINYTGTAVLGANVGLGAIGAYNRAYGLYRRAQAVPTQLSRLYFPTLCAMYMEDDRAGMAQVYRLTSRYLVLVMLPAVTWLAACAPGVMGLFGPGFDVAATTLGILGFVAVIDLYGRLAGGVSSAANKPGRISLATSAGAAIIGVGCLLLVPPLGLTGAALAHLAGYAAIMLVSSRLASRDLDRSLVWMFEPRFLLRLSLACLVLALGVFPLRGLEAALLWQALAAPALLALGLALARPLERDDVDLVQRALKAAGMRSTTLLTVVARLHRLMSHRTRRREPAPA